jgi:hypothetical protein
VKRKPERKLLGVLTVDEAVRQAMRQHKENAGYRAASRKGKSNEQ